MGKDAVGVGSTTKTTYFWVKILEAFILYIGESKWEGYMNGS